MKDTSETFKSLTAETDNNLISALLLRAKNIILTETNRTELPKSLEGTWLEVALELYNRQGSEAEKSRSEGGVSVVYYDSLSKTTLNGLRRHRLARVAGHAFEKKQTETVQAP